jgi:hypothetical protein
LKYIIQHTMKKLILALGLTFSLTSCTELLKVLEAGSNLNTITESEAASGLKNALELGVNNGTDFLGKTDGFLKNAAYRILMPEEVQNVVDQIKSNPIANTLAGPFIGKVETAMNRGAERAMAEAKPIFVNAIKAMTIRDAINIVKGGEGAATEYLIRATSDQLRVKFRPVIKESLDKVNINEPWTKVSSAYNMVTGKKVETDLNDYVTERAMEALFSQIKQEENKIRKDPVARVTPILKKVFNYADQFK